MARVGLDYYDGMDDATPHARQRRNTQGGSKQNLTTLGSDDTADCDRCDQKAGHDWPGKAEGEPHPPFTNRKGSNVNTMTDTGINPRHVSQYKRKVRELVLHLVNDLGVRHRVIDGSHLLLYSPSNADARPYKVSASRSEETMMSSLTGWAKVQVPEYGKEPEKKPPLADILPPVAPQPESVVTGMPRPEALTEPKGGRWEPRDAADHKLRDLIAEGWKPHVGAKNKTVRFYVNAEGTQWKCVQCGALVDKVTSLGGHLRGHSDVPLATEEGRAKAAEVRRAKAAARREVGEVKEPQHKDLPAYVNDAPDLAAAKAAARAVGADIGKAVNDNMAKIADAMSSRQETAETGTLVWDKEYLTTALVKIAEAAGLELPKGEDLSGEVDRLKRELAAMTKRAEDAEAFKALVLEAAQP
jgi:hypothetical protein